MIPMFMFFPNSTTSGTPYVGGDWVFSSDYGSIALAAATGKNVFVPYGETENLPTAAGTYSGSNLAAIKLAPGQKIVGADKTTSVIEVDGNGRGIQLSPNSGVYNVTIKGINGGAYQVGICTNDIDFEIEGVKFLDITGTDNAGGGGGAIQFIGNTGIDYLRGGRVAKCDFEDCVTGLNIMERAEFITITDTKYFNCGTAIANRGGNNTFTTGVMVGNDLGFYVAQGFNSGHGTITDFKINHNTTNIKIEDQALGFGFTDVHSYEGHISISTSNDIVFGSGCHLVGYPTNPTPTKLTLNGNTANGVRISNGAKFDIATYDKDLTGSDYIRF